MSAEFVHREPEPVRAPRAAVEQAFVDQRHEEAVHGAGGEAEASRELRDSELTLRAGEGLEDPRRVPHRRQRCCGAASPDHVEHASSFVVSRHAGRTPFQAVHRLLPSNRPGDAALIAARAHGPRDRSAVWTNPWRSALIAPGPSSTASTASSMPSTPDTPASRCWASSPGPDCPRPPCTGPSARWRPWAGSSAGAAGTRSGPGCSSGQRWPAASSPCATRCCRSCRSSAEPPERPRTWPSSTDPTCSTWKSWSDAAPSRP